MGTELETVLQGTAHLTVDDDLILDLATLVGMGVQVFPIFELSNEWGRVPRRAVAHVAIVTTSTHDVVTKEVSIMTSVGVRELKGQLSRYLKRVKNGERLAITERGKLIAVLAAPAASAAEQEVESMLREGIASWEGGKPAGAPRPKKIAGRSVADTVLEDRR